MIKLNDNDTVEIMRMLTNYVEELNNTLETQDNGRTLVQYLESEIADAEIMVEKLKPFAKSLPTT